jgi:hypothetical protein
LSQYNIRQISAKTQDIEGLDGMHGFKHRECRNLEMEDCTFHPQINENSIKIVEMTGG